MSVKRLEDNIIYPLYKDYSESTKAVVGKQTAFFKYILPPMSSKFFHEKTLDLDSSLSSLKISGYDEFYKSFLSDGGMEMTAFRIYFESEEHKNQFLMENL